MRDVNAEQIARILADESTRSELQSVKDSIELQKAIQEEQKTKPKIKKLDKKLKIAAVKVSAKDTPKESKIALKSKPIKLKKRGQIKIVS